MDWTSALLNAPNFIFDSSAKRIVEYKWQQGRYYVYAMAIPYQIQSIIIILDFWSFEDKYWTKYVLLVLNGLLFLVFLTRMCIFLNYK